MSVHSELKKMTAEIRTSGGRTGRSSVNKSIWKNSDGGLTLLRKLSERLNVKHLTRRRPGEAKLAFASAPELKYT